MACSASKLTANISRQCQNPLARGVKEVMYLAMKEDITAYVLNDTNPKIINGITLAAGAKIYKVEGVNYTNNVLTGFNQTEFGNYIPHNVNFLVINNSASVKVQLEALMTRKDIVAFAKREGNGPWEAHGFSTGLRVTNNSSNANDEGTKGGYQIELSAPDEIGYPLELQLLDEDDEDVTATTLAGMVSPTNTL